MVHYARSLFYLLAAASPLSVLAQTLTEALSRDDLSTLRALVGQFPGLLDGVAETGGTILAPTNAAFANFLRSAGVSSPAEIPADTVRALLTYHVLPQALNGEALSGRGGAVAATALSSGPFANLNGSANVLFASAYGSAGLDAEASGLKIYSGVGTPANVTAGDIPFHNGFVHVISSVLNIPQNCSSTAEAASLNTLLSALNTANLTTTVDTVPRLTCFAPTDAAFTATGIDLSALGVDELAEVLKYHTIVGDVGYSTELEDGQEYETLAGASVVVNKRDGQLFINNVAVAQGNVITSNGVAHVLSGVLLPSAPGAPSGSGSSGSPTSASGSTGTTPAGGSVQTSQSSDAEAVRSTIYSTILAGLVMTTIICLLG